MDKSAVGHDYVAPHFKHASQIDYSSGFGGKYGVQSDRIDKVLTVFLFIKLIFFFEIIGIKYNIVIVINRTCVLKNGLIPNFIKYLRVL